jgi:hypothetical protein
MLVNLERRKSGTWRGLAEFSRKKVLSLILAQSFSPFSARDGRQTCCPAMTFSVTKMQEENKIAQLVF